MIDRNRLNSVTILSVLTIFILSGLIVMNPELTGLFFDQEMGVVEFENFNLTNTWSYTNSINYSNNQAIFSNIINETLVYNFTGKFIKIKYSTRPDFGTLEINIDGKISIINQSGNVSFAEVTIDKLKNTKHTITFKVLENKYITLDALYIPYHIKQNLVDLNLSDFDYETTFKVKNPKKIKNFTLQKNKTKVKWHNEVNLKDKDIKNNAVLDTDFISINSSNLLSLNSTATVTIENITCDKFELLYSPGFITSKENFNGTIIATENNLGGNCDDNSVCTNLICTNNNLQFTAHHFSTFLVRFEPPTPNGTTINVSNIFVNASINTTNPLQKLLFEWQGTNYSIYDNDLVLMCDFANTDGLEINTSQNISDGLVGLWHLDESSGNATDSSINNNNGIVNGAIQNTAGKFKSAYSFNGINDYVNISDDNSLDGMDEITISSWFKLNDDGNLETVLSKDTVGQRSYTLSISGGRIYAHVFTTQSDYVYGRSSNLVNDSLWHNVVVTWTNVTPTTLKVYVDGINRTSNVATFGTPSGSVFAGTSNLVIGSNNYNGLNYYFNGSIDEVSIWNRSLSSTEIKELYNRSIIDDNSLYSNTGEIYGASNIDGKYGSALEFDGVDDYINLGNDSSLSITNSITFSTWIKSTQNSSHVQIFNKNFDGSTYSYYFGIDNSKPSLYLGGISPSPGWYTSDTNVTTGSWKYLTYVYDGSKITIYIDGILDKTFTGLSGSIYSNPETSVWLGMRSDVTTSRQYKGILDESYLWNRSLSADEIEQQYKSSLQKHSNTYWTFQSNQTNLTPGTYNYSVYAFDGTTSNTTGTTNTTYKLDLITPKINFTSPTPDNNTITTNTSVTINVSLIESNLKEFIFNWNGSDYNIYNDNLILMYNFNNVSTLGESSTKAVDLSLEENNATLTSTSYVSGIYDDAISFSGSSYGTLGDIDKLSFGDGTNDYPFSVSLWVKQESGNIGDDGLISKYWNGVGFEWAIRISNGKPGLVIRDNSASAYKAQTADNSIANGIWHHVVTTYNGNKDYSGINIYVDGIQVTDTSSGSGTYTAMENTSANVYLGQYYSTVQRFNGQIDELLIYNKTLTLKEINQLYNSNLQKYNSTSWTYTTTQNITEAKTYNYSATAIDISNNTNITGTYYLTKELDLTNPQINFTSPTPDNNTITTNTSVTINVSLLEENLKDFIFNWNGTNYSVYNNDLVLMYNFNNVSELGENNTFVKDLSLTNNDGIIYSANYTGGKYGSALDFDGINDYVESTGYEYTTFTFSTWVKTNYANGASHLGIVEFSDIAGNRKGLGIDASGNIVVYYYDGSRKYVASSESIIDNLWHHLVGGYNGTSPYLYVDDVSISLGSSSALGGGLSNKLHVGDLVYTSPRLFKGMIDEVKLYNRSLTQNEITQLYNSNLQKINSTQWTYTTTQNITEAKNYNYSATVIDISENTNTTGTYYLTKVLDLTNPQINFTSPTPANNTITTNNSILINVSLIEENLKDFIFNWNGTNYSIYDNDLILMLNLNNNSELGENDSKVADISNNKLTGNIYGATYTTGKYDQALNFTGSDYVSLQDNDLWDFKNNEYAISLWVNFNSVNTDMTFIGNLIANTNGWMFDRHSGQLRFVYWDPTTTARIIDEPWTPVIGNWYNIVVVKDNEFVQLYVDGKPLGSSSNLPQNMKNGTGPLLIGKYSYAGGTNYFDGGMDEIIIYNKSLTQNEIKQLYNSTLQKYNSTHWTYTTTQNITEIKTYNYSATAIDIGNNTNITGTYYLIKEKVKTSPQINFTLPTPANGTSTYNTTHTINVTIAETALTEFIFDWNGTNYSIYNNDLVLKTSFDKKGEELSSYDPDHLWHLNELTGNAIDSSGNNDGTVNGGISRGIDGEFNTAYNFDGSNDYVNSTTLPYVENFSMSLWFRNVTNTWNILLSQSVWNDLSGFAIIPLGGWYRIYTNSVEKTYIAPVTSDYDWHQIGIVWNNTNCDVYFDGVYQRTGTNCNFTNSGTPLMFGVRTNNDNTGLTNYMHGDLDEIAFWNKSLTKIEMQEVYNKSLVLFDDSILNNSIFTLSNLSNGKYDKALDFDGVDDYAELDSELIGTGEVTTCAWINPNTWGESTYGRILDNRKFLFWISKTYGTAESVSVYCDGVTGAYSAANSISLNTWQHVCAVRNSNNKITFYINGVQSGTANQSCGTPAAGTSNLFIGNRNTLDRAFNGTIDELVIYNKSLTQNEITQLYNSNLQKINSTSWTYTTTQTNLTIGNYTYQAFAKNIYNKTNQTEKRNLEIISLTNQPPTVQLIDIVNNVTVDRTPTLIWNGTDLDNDNLTYNLQLSNESNFNNLIINITTNNTQYTSNELDVDTTYYWRVRANDSYIYGNFNETNFTINSFLSVNLLNSNINFSTMNLTESDNTTDNDPLPFIIENDGNIPINISINATQLFDTVTLPSENYKYKIDEYESNSYTNATTTWTQMNTTNNNIDIENLNWRDNQDTAETEIYIKIPSNEPAGTKTTIVNFRII